MRNVYTFEGLDCAKCADNLEIRLSKIKGVLEANVDFFMKKIYLEIGDEGYEKASLIAERLIAIAVDKYIKI